MAIAGHALAGQNPVPEIGAGGAASAMTVIGGLVLMARARRKR